MIWLRITLKTLSTKIFVDFLIIKTDWNKIQSKGLKFSLFWFDTRNVFYFRQYKQAIELDPTKLIKIDDEDRLNPLLVEHCAALSVDQTPIQELTKAIKGSCPNITSRLDPIKIACKLVGFGILYLFPHIFFKICMFFNILIIVAYIWLYANWFSISLYYHQRNGTIFFIYYARISELSDVYMDIDSIILEAVSLIEGEENDAKQVKVNTYTKYVCIYICIHGY